MVLDVAIPEFVPYLKNEWYGGIDPGAYGCLALYRKPDSSVGGDIGELYLIDLKQAKGIQSKGMTPEHLAHELRLFLATIGRPIITLVETPSSMPSDGVVSAFSFGKACGLIEGIFYGLELPFVGTVPSVWKNQMGLTREKQFSIEKARSLFKDVKIHHALEIDAFVTPKRHADGRAEAALLAYLAAHKLGAK